MQASQINSLSSTSKLRVDLVIPMYNEEEQIEWSVTTLRDFALQNLMEYNWRIVVADNASKDKTLEIAKKLSDQYQEVTYHHMEIKGRGKSLVEVWGKSDADICAYMDTDHSTDLKHLPVIIGKIAHEGYDIAIGSRNLPGSVVNRGFKRTFISKSYITIIKMIMLFGVHFSDAQCGFKAASRKAINEIFPLLEPDKWDGGKIGSAWFFDTEFLVIADKAGYKIYEEPVKWTEDPGTTVHIVRDAVEDIRGLLRLQWKRPWRKIKKA